MSQANKTCEVCHTLGHSKFYCKDKPRKPLKRNAIKQKTSNLHEIVGIKKKPAKKRSPTRSQFVKKLDKVFSEWLRLSYADKDGNVSCYTCGEVMQWKYIQNGHFFSRARQNTRWLPENCRPQDYRCNVALSGNYIVYTRKMLAEIGETKLDEMEQLSKSTNKISTPLLKEMIAEYEAKTKLLIGG